MTYDIVIRGGRVIDGTGRAEFKADIAIQGNRIAEVGDVKEKGTREVDAEGKLVTPALSTFIRISTPSSPGTPSRARRATTA